MKTANASLLALLLPAVAARFVEPGEPVQAKPSTSFDKFKWWIWEKPQKYHIEIAPGKTQWVTEDEKWELRRVSHVHSRLLAAAQPTDGEPPR